MRVQLDAAEVRTLLGIIDAAHRERLHQIHHADSREFRERLEREAEQLDSLRARLIAIRREEMLDESVEESFPASDAPAHSGER